MPPSTPHSDVPVLETSRLRLRGHRPDDFADCAAMWADPCVTRYIGGVPSTREEVWSRMLRYAGLWKWLGYGYWVVEDKGSGSFVGELGFADFKREIQPMLAGIPELGWALASAFHGKGLATEAVLAVLQWGDTHLDQCKTACIISPENGPSLRVAEKVGFCQAQLTTYKGKETLIHFRETPDHRTQGENID